MPLDSREPESRRQRSDRRSVERDRRDDGRQSAESSSRRSRSRSRSHSRRGDRSRSPQSRRSQGDDRPDASRRQRGSKWDVSGGTAEKRSLSEAIVPAVPASVPATLSPTLLSPFFESAPAHLGPPKQTVEIDQRFATYVIGRSSEWMRPIEAATGAVVKLDCSAGPQGPSICRVYGDEDVVSIAADMIRIRLATADGSLPEATVTEKVDIEHTHVFKILGKDGEAVKQLGMDTGAGVTFQRGPITSESVDYLLISGQKERVDVAKRLVQKRLDEAMTLSFGQEASNPPEASCGIPVEQQFIGWIMGKSKENIRQIADQSGAFIQVKQSSKSEGHSIIKISGTHAAVSAARVRIQQRVDHGRKYQDDKKKQFIAGDWLCPVCGDQQFRRNDTCRRCNTTRPILAADSEKTGGEKGGGKHDTGTFLKRDSDTAFQVDQQYVGFIIGPGGTTLRDIKEATRAKIFVDQETRDQGFSIVRIGDAGTPENLSAQDIIEQKIDEGLERTQRMPLQADGNRNGVPATSVPHVTIVPPPQQPTPQRVAAGLPQIVLPAGWSPPAGPNGTIGAASGGGQWSSSEWGGNNWTMDNAKQSMMNMYWGGASTVADPSANAEKSIAGATAPSAPPLTSPELALPALEEDDAIEILGPVIVEAVGLATREEQQGHFFKHLEPLRPRLTSELYDKIVASFEEALAE